MREPRRFAITTKRMELGRIEFVIDRMIKLVFRQSKGRIVSFAAVFISQGFERLLDEEPFRGSIHVQRAEVRLFFVRVVLQRLPLKCPSNFLGSRSGGDIKNLVESPAHPWALETSVGVDQV